MGLFKNKKKQEQLEKTMFPWLNEDNFDNRWRKYTPEECWINRLNKL